MRCTANNQLKLERLNLTEIAQVNSGGNLIILSGNITLALDANDKNSLLVNGKTYKKDKNNYNYIGYITYNNFYGGTRRGWRFTIKTEDGNLVNFDGANNVGTSIYNQNGQVINNMSLSEIPVGTKIGIVGNLNTGYDDIKVFVLQ